MSDVQPFMKMDLTTLFLSISSTAYMGMGIFPGEGQGLNPQKIDLSLVRQNIDFLELMEEKTRGNRTLEEDRLLEQLLSDVRLKYLEVQKRLKTR